MHLKYRDLTDFFLGGGGEQILRYLIAISDFHGCAFVRYPLQSKLLQNDFF